MRNVFVVATILFELDQFIRIHFIYSKNFISTFELFLALNSFLPKLEFLLNREISKKKSYALLNYKIQWILEFVTALLEYLKERVLGLKDEMLSLHK